MKTEKFSYAYDLGGATVPKISEYPIAAATAITEGAAVVLTAGLVVLANANSQAAILGFAAENHDGASDGQKGKTIAIYDSPTVVMKCKPENQSIVNDTAGATFVEGGLTTPANDAFNYGWLKMTKAPNLTVGSPIIIADYVGATGTFTATLTGGTLVGDTATLFPPLLAVAFATNATCNNLDLNTAAGTALKICKNDFVDDYVYVTPALHLLGNKAS